MKAISACLAARGWDLTSIRDFISKADELHLSEADMLYECKRFNEDEILEILCEAYDAITINLDSSALFLKGAVVTLGVDYCIQEHIAFVQVDGVDYLVTLNPSNTENLEKIQAQVGIYKIAVAYRADFNKFIESYERPLLLSSISKNFDSGMTSMDTMLTISEATDSAIQTLIKNLIELAYNCHASDIHIVPDEKLATVYFRVDGKRIKKSILDKSALPPLHRILGSLAGQQTHDESKIVQGKIMYPMPSTNLELRLNIIPTRLGSSINLRLHLQDVRDIETLTDNIDIQKLFGMICNLSEGLVLFCGPTGSGKSTSMMAIARRLLDHNLNICDVEDPVEQVVPGINQVDVVEAKSITYETVSKSFLRHDPDVLIIGEIRDLAVATAALQSSDTGHLVLSTLHTKNSASAVNRLLDLGVSSAALADNLAVVISQRLVRKLCPKCKKKQVMEPGDERYDIFNLNKDRTYIYYAPCGCSSCGNTGYSGRLVLFEYMIVTSNIQKAILNKTATNELTALLTPKNFHSLLEDGIARVLSGETSFEELMPLITSDHLRRGDIIDAGW